MMILGGVVAFWKSQPLTVTGLDSWRDGGEGTSMTLKVRKSVLILSISG
jgi:hypothetical protein